VFAEVADRPEKEENLSGLRPTIFAVVILVLGVAGCGGEDGPERRQADERAATATETTAAKPRETSEEESAQPGGKSTNARDAALAGRPPGEEGLRVPATQARIVAKKSAFGRVLFDANGQVVYAFEDDRKNRSNCTSEECVKAWPPVLTREEPSAGEGADGRLLGTIRRSDGRLQVTYNGRPLYFYEHEAPGEIKCHNVELHGGLWWVVTPRGDPVD
jgi:predicted lipoprotein with Yx(FWY)xxD motif